MKINIFKNKLFWKNLEKYNEDIMEVYNRYQFKDDKKAGRITWWFDPNKIKELELHVRGTKRIWRLPNNDLDYNLNLNPHNYLILFLLPILYSNKYSPSLPRNNQLTLPSSISLIKSP